MEEEKPEPFAHWDKPNWDEYFMSMSLLVAMRSIDPSAKHGCIIVDKNKKVLSLGYNGPPRGCKDELLPLTKRPHKYLLVEHAEKNAIINRQLSVEGATLYVTGPPCLNCMRSIIQSGIARVVHGPFKSRGISELDDQIINMIMHDRKDLVIDEFKGDMLKCIQRASDYFTIKSEINKNQPKLKSNEQGILN